MNENINITFSKVEIFSWEIHHFPTSCRLTENEFGHTEVRLVTGDGREVVGGGGKSIIGRWREMLEDGGIWREMMEHDRAHWAIVRDAGTGGKQGHNSAPPRAPKDCMCLAFPFRSLLWRSDRYPS